MTMYMRDRLHPKPALKHIDTSSFQPIPVVQSQERKPTCSNTYEDLPGDELVRTRMEVNNNLLGRQCKFCVKGQVRYNDRNYCIHIKSHHDLMFKCSVCHSVFEVWSDTLRHMKNIHRTEDERLIRKPGSAERLVNANCKMKKCKRQFMAANCK